MREWQVGDLIGDGNDIGVPDVKYMDYLKNKDNDAPIKNTNVKSSDIKKSKLYQDEALKYVNKALKITPNDEYMQNTKQAILNNINNYL